MMQKFTIEEGVAAPLLRANIDTDAIIPQTESVTAGRTGLGKGLFARWRYDLERRENPEFVLNQAGFRRAKFLLTGPNFGCGSSREHAVWALMDFGIRAVIAPAQREMLLEGLDEIGLTLRREAEIAAFQERDRRERPWAYAVGSAEIDASD